MEVMKGHDSKLRSVRVKMGNGETALHSIRHLCHLELSIAHSGTSQNEANKPKNKGKIPSDDQTNDDNEKPDDGINPNTGRARRKAAVKYRCMILAG